MRRVEYATLHSPGHRLGNCVFLVVERDTRGVHLSDADRFNYFPATPFPSMTWILDGKLHMVESSAKDVSTLGNPLPNAILSGPTRKPSVSWSPGEIRVLTISFYPEALARLLGSKIEQYVGTVLPLEKVISVGRLGHLATVQLGRDPFAQVRDLLNCLWDEEPAQQHSDIRSWLARLATRSASVAGITGRRSAQRFVKYWTGQSLRDLQLYARAETAFSHGGKLPNGERCNFAAVAAESGFSDQSHLGREVRRVTGLPPAKLKELVEQGEPFWIYRLLK